MVGFARHIDIAASIGRRSFKNWPHWSGFLWWSVIFTLSPSEIVFQGAHRRIQSAREL